jgi:hypothetical protein
MGLLDDAIRQHLELKRRHGADPSDVAKLEHEALGPTTRPEPVAPSTPDAAAVADETVYDEEEPSYDEAELEAEERPAEPAAPPPEPAAPPPQPAAPPPQPVVAEREPPVPEPSPAPLASAPEPEPLRPGGSVRLDDVGERTLDPPAADHKPDPQPDAEPGEHDELEETPEFLQETPEHDRLWFEQKPPRDFDF